MKILGAPQLFKQLEGGRLSNLYYLYGPEEYLLGKALKSIKDRVIAPEVEATDCRVFYAREGQPSEIIGCARTYPFGGGRRLVLVKEAQLFSIRELDEFIPYLASPPPYTTLVFLAQGEEKRGKFLENLSRQGVVVAFEHPTGDSFRYWVKEMARERGKTISPEAIEFLRENVGGELNRIYGELSKVSSYIGEREVIEISDLTEVLAGVRIEVIFRLLEMLGRRDLPGTLTVLGRLLGAGESLLHILPLLANHFRMIWIIKDLAHRGLGEGEIGRKLRIPNRLLARLRGEADHFTEGELYDIFEDLGRIDRSLKSGGGRERVLLEQLLREVCRVKQG